MAASVCPAVTVSPTLTSTAVTLPLWANVRLAWLAGSIVPVAETVSLTVSVVAATSWVVVADSAAAAGRCRYTHAPTAAATSTRSAGTAIQVRRRRRRLGGDSGVCSIPERRLC